MTEAYEQLDAWVDAHFDEQTRFLQELVRVPTDTPPGNNAPHAERTAALLEAFGFTTEKHPVPQSKLKEYGLESITNLPCAGLMATQLKATASLAALAALAALASLAPRLR